MSYEQHITVPPEDDGQRLDRWLKKRMPFVLAQKLVRKGAVRIDGKKARGDMKLEEGQVVRIPPFEEQRAVNARIPLTDEEREFIRSTVIYDDDDIVVINKPHGLASQGGRHITQHVDGLTEGLKAGGLQPKLVHRLDRDTSGLMILARRPDTLRMLGRQFKNRQIEKIYWALLSPVPETLQGTIKAPLIKSGPAGNMVIDEEEGKVAITDFVVVERASGTAAFAAFKPLTGRTHQIRVHASAVLETPILGDERYMSDMTVFEDMEITTRLHLHARQLSIQLPNTRKKLELTAPLPEELRQSWKAFGFDPDYAGDCFDGSC